MEIEVFYFPSDYHVASWDKNEKLFRGGICLNDYFFHFKKMNGEIIFFDEEGQDALYIIKEVGEDKILEQMKEALEHISFLESLMEMESGFEFDLKKSEIKQIDDFFRIYDARLSFQPDIYIDFDFNKATFGQMIVTNQPNSIFCHNFDEALTEKQKEKILKFILNHPKMQSFIDR